MVVYDVLKMFGKPRDVVWTSLSETFTAGEDVIKVVDKVDWKAGEEIVVSTSTFESRETEKFIIKSVDSDNKTITLESSANHTHR